jgi:PPOX class probable F420-dependent enzyme
MAQLTDKVRTLFDGKNFAVLSTLEPDGRPHSTVVWVKCDGDDLLFALPKSRRKIANLNRDPRAAVVIFDADSPMRAPRCRAPRPSRTTRTAR